MSISEMIFWTVIAAVFIYFLIRFVRNAEIEGAVVPPKHVSIADADKFTPQEVYDWVVYVTRMTGNAYLNQLVWSRGCKHDFLLSDLSTVLHARTEEEKLERMKEIGHSFNLDTSIVDEPF